MPFTNAVLMINYLSLLPVSPPYPQPLPPSNFRHAGPNFLGIKDNVDIYSAAYIDSPVMNNIGYYARAILFQILEVTMVKVMVLTSMKRIGYLHKQYVLLK